MKNLNFNIHSNIRNKNLRTCPFQRQNTKKFYLHTFRLIHFLLLFFSILVLLKTSFLTNSFSAENSNNNKTNINTDDEAKLLDPIDYKDVDTNTSNKTTEEIVNLHYEKKGNENEINAENEKIEVKANKNVIKIKPKQATNSKNNQAQKKFIGIFYLNKIFANIHQRPSADSDSIKAIACAHPLKMYEMPSSSSSDSEWALVHTENEEGYIKKSFISEQRNIDCFQNNYPKFFNSLNLDMTQIYYWGKLQDQFLYGKSKVK
ncbi:MAG: hypothetical protein HQK51_00665 [Oligoflexia bacterium]|nr:hypothetical protein [Oligoflexia bacterium]